MTPRGSIAAVEGGSGLGWRSAVVPVPARGVVRVPGSPVVPRGRLATSPGPAPDSGAQWWAEAVEAIVAWCTSGDGPLWLVEGPAGSGKTRLAAEVADRLSALGRPCGWARPGLGTFAVAAAARNGGHALVLVDDAETRADLADLLRTLANGGTPLPVRVLMLAREFGPWWETIQDQLPVVELDALAAQRSTLGGGRVDPPSPRALALRSLELATTGSAAETMAMLHSADPATGAVLLRQAALVVALSTRVGQLGPAQVRAALRDLFEEEEGYWRRAAAEVSAPGQPNPALRSALAASAVVGGDGLGDAATVLRRVPALAVGAADRLARLALWWHGLYARSGDSSAATPQLPAWLADRLPDSDSDERSGVSWTVSALAAERRATSTLAKLALQAHRDIWPHAVKAAQATGDATIRDAQAVHDALRQGVEADSPVDEALAWLTSELELRDDELGQLGDAVSYPSRAMARTAIALARRLLESTGDESDRAVFLLGLGARYAELEQWDEARDHTAAAVHSLRQLARGDDRATYLPDLAGAVGNLGSCLMQVGDLDDAVAAGYEAVELYRELVDGAGDGMVDGAVDGAGDAYLPELARTLVSLCACLSRAGRLEPAVGAAGRAVVLYRTLSRDNPGHYLGELAAAEHNWQVCHDALTGSGLAIEGA